MCIRDRGTLSLTVYAANIVEPQVIKLNTDKLSLMSDKTARLSVSFDPSRTDSGLKGLVWESDNEEIATVSSTGIVTAKKAGTTTIRVRSAVLPDLEDEVIVSVTAPLTYYRFLETSNTTVNSKMIVGAMDDIEIFVRTKDGSQPNISLKNSDESVVALSVEGSRGTVKALKPGTRTLTIDVYKRQIIRILHMKTIKR